MTHDTLNETKIFGDGLERVAVRPITHDIFWITHCLGDLASQYYAHYFASLPNAADYTDQRIVDYPFSAFLIRDEKSLLIDTTAPRQQANMIAALEYALGGKPLDYVFISHIELPHAGNTPAILRRYPGATVFTVTEGEHYDLHNLGGAQLLAPGDVVPLGRHALEVVEALFVDHGLSMWAYERHSGMLFTADWAHNLHEPARQQCFMFLDEMEADGYPPDMHLDDVKVNAWFQFPWLKWSDPDRIAAAIESLFERYEVKILAPSHGNVIRRHIGQYVPLLVEGMRRAAGM